VIEPSIFELKRLKYMSTIEMGQSPPSSEYSSSPESGLPFLQGTADFGVEYPDPKTFCSVPSKSAQKNDILFSVRAPVGELNIANRDYGIGRGVCAVRCTNSLYQRFAWWALHWARQQLDSEATGSTYEAVTVDDVANLFIPTLPFYKQQTIADYLDHEITYIDTLTNAKQRLIELLEEKKRALIIHTITNGINELLPTIESGIEWAYRIPVNWKVEPLFSALHERKQINRGNVVDNVLSLSYGNIVKRDVESNFGLLPESFESYQIVYPGDIILRLTDLQNDKRSLRVGLVKEKGIITSAYVCLRCTDKIIPEYTYYLLHTYDLLKVFYNFGGGVRQTMRFEDLRRLPLILPDIETQQKIVNSLGNLLPKFVLLIEKLTISISLLYEKRNTLISAAVTGQIEIPEVSCN